MQQAVTIAEQLASLSVRRLAQLLVAGMKKSRMKGNGSDFDQLRDYQLGDAIRSVDWKSSAKVNRIIVRSHTDDQRLSIAFLIDSSRSGTVVSTHSTKFSKIINIACLLAQAAELAGARSALLMFHDQVEIDIPFGSGKQHMAALQATLASATPVGNHTSLRAAFEASCARYKPGTLLILISDGMSADYQQVLPLIAARYELMVIRVLDPVEREFPQGVLVSIQDPESGLELSLTSAGQMQKFCDFIEHWHAQQTALHQELGLAAVDILTHESYEEKLLYLLSAYRARGLR